MEAVKIILFILGGLVVLALIVSAYYGAFTKVEFRTEVQGGEVLVYETVTGDYSQSPAVMDRVYKALLNDEKIETTKGFGLYYDDPKKVEKSKRRSEVGCVIDNPDAATIAKLSAKYQVKTFPRSTYLVTEFPFKGKMSVLFGIFKVYPAMSKYIVGHAIPDGPIMELYDVPNKKIIYRKEAAK